MKIATLFMLAGALTSSISVAQAGPTNLVLRGTLTNIVGGWGDPWRVQVSGNTAYAAGGASGLKIIDVRDPSHPALSGTYSNGASTADLQVIGNLAYLANGTNCLEIVDVSDPTQPRRVGGFKPPGYYRRAESIYVRDNLAYLIDSTMFILNVSDPSNVVQLCNMDNAGHAADLEVVGNYAYLATEHSVSIFNVSNRFNPTWAGAYWCPFPQELSVQSNFVFFASRMNGFQILDVSNPANPTRLSQYPTDPYNWYGWGLAMAGDYAFAAFDDKGIVVLDVRDRARPVRVAGYDTPGYAQGLCVAGDFVFVAELHDLLILEIEPAGEPPLMTITWAETNASISWPASALGYALVTNSDLSVSNWYPVVESPQLSGESFSITRPAVGNVFYRLRRQ